MKSDTLPTIALSVRQPWAWLIIHGFKDFENRDWSRANPSRKQVELATVMRRPFDVLIHAAATCTVAEYSMAMNYVHAINHRRREEGLPEIIAPHHGHLERGGIVGVVTIVSWSDHGTESLWSSGPGLVLGVAKPLKFIPCAGALGFFKPQLP